MNLLVVVSERERKRKKKQIINPQPLSYKARTIILFFYNIISDFHQVKRREPKARKKEDLFPIRVSLCNNSGY